MLSRYMYVVMSMLFLTEYAQAAAVCKEPNCIAKVLFGQQSQHMAALRKSLHDKTETIKNLKNEIEELRRENKTAAVFSEHIKGLRKIAENRAQEIQRLQQELAQARSIIATRDTLIAKLQMNNGSAQNSRVYVDVSKIAVQQTRQADGNILFRVTVG